MMLKTIVYVIVITVHVIVITVHVIAITVHVIVPIVHVFVITDVHVIVIILMQGSNMISYIFNMI